jgi:integrase
MAIYRRGKIYWCSFRFEGKHVQESTGQKTPTKATEYEEDRQSELRKEFERRVSRAKELGCKPEDIHPCAECGKLFFATSVESGELLFCDDDCRDKQRKRQSPTLAEFLEKDFLPYTETTHAAKPATLRYYKAGAASLTASTLATLRIDKITDQHATQYAAKLKKLSPSTVNMGLRCLRRSLNLAYDWGVISGRPKISLAKGERQRERVLTDAEIKLYLEACEQPWRDCAVIMLGTGARPGEVFALRWERIQLNGSGGLLQITEGKSKAARRILPMVPIVYQTLKARHQAEEEPERGWVFGAETKSGHLEGYCAKNQHAAALLAIKEEAEEAGIKNPVRAFPPYTMRHTALTRLAESGCDAFTLAKIAGHSSITITQRYCHPQAEAIDRAFSKWGSLPGSLQNSLQSENRLLEQNR